MFSSTTLAPPLATLVQPLLRSRYALAFGAVGQFDACATRSSCDATHWVHTVRRSSIIKKFDALNIRQLRLSCIWSKWKKEKNKKHSENVDNSTSVTFDLDVWPWPCFKVKKAYVIRYCLLYCALVSGMMSVNVIVCETWSLIYYCDLWPSPVTFSLCQGHFHSNQ